jgi:hypothetical protein
VDDTDNDDRRNYDPTGTHSGQGTEGEFYVFVSSTSSGDVDVTVSEGGVSDTGTATVFDAVDSVAVEPESDTADLESSLNVTATAQTSDGTTIEVPRLTLNDLSSDNTTVVERTSLSEESNGGTFANGTVEATFDTKTTEGTANITADIAGATGEAPITVAEQAPDFQLELVDGPTTITQNESYSATVNVTNEDGAPALSLKSLNSETRPINLLHPVIDGFDMAVTAASDGGLPHRVYSYTRIHTEESL